MIVGIHNDIPRKKHRSEDWIVNYLFLEFLSFYQIKTVQMTAGSKSASLSPDPSAGMWVSNKYSECDETGSLSGRPCGRGHSPTSDNPEEWS